MDPITGMQKRMKEAQTIAEEVLQENVILMEEIKRLKGIMWQQEKTFPACTINLLKKEIQP